MKRVSLLVAVISFLFVFGDAPGDLVGLWRFEEGSGSVAADSTIYNNDGILVADTEAGDPAVPLTGTTEPNWISRVVEESSAYALEFCAGTGNYNHVEIPKSDSLKSLGSTWAFAMWIRQDSRTVTPGGGGGYPRIVSCPMYEIELGVPSWEYDYFWPYGTSVFQTDIGTSYIGGGGTLGTWYHLALTYDGAALKKYINGTLVANSVKNISGQSLNNNWDDSGWTDSPLKLASQVWPNKDWFIGALDDVAIFNQSLTEEQIADIMSGDFSGPWTGTPVMTTESDLPVTYLWNSSFKNGVDGLGLGYGEMAPNATLWNWQRDGINDDPNLFGIINVSRWDANDFSIEYAGYCTVGDQITQVALGKKAFDNIKYSFTARVGGIDAVGDSVGVRLYRVDPNEPYGNAVLLADIYTTITANETWYELSTTYTSSAADQNQRFKVVCYIEQGTGSGRGTAFGCFDSVRIDPVEFYTCQAILDYNNGSSGFSGDFNNNCRIELEDYSVVAEEWYGITSPEPSVNTGELLTNSDFYADIDLVPNNEDYVAAAPTGWEFVPATSDPLIAGIQNLDRNGIVAHRPNQPAGGSVVAYIDPDTELRQTISAPVIQNGQTYYVSAMVGGLGGSYLSMLTMTLQVVDNPTAPTSVVDVADADFVMPENLVWRQITTEYTADALAAGKYLRLRFTYGPNPFPGATADGYGAIGKASVTTTKPAVWPRANLLVNGDFEDYSSLPQGTNNNDGYLDLFSYVTHYTMDLIPGWDNTSNAMYYSGLQCMLWVPAPQPAMGRVSAWFADKIEQKVTSETIQAGQTYYIDYVACINGSAYVNTNWPAVDPNMVVDVYWLAPGQNNLSGTEGRDWGLITSVQTPISGPVLGNPDYQDSPYTPWLLAEGEVIADASLAGKSFYVSAYCNDASVDYATFEEIYLSKEPKVQIGPYTCYEQKNTYNIDPAADLNDDCAVDLDDLVLFVGNWLGCAPDLAGGCI